MSTIDTFNETPRASVLKEIFDRYAEETITEEQLRRVLEPVLQMIREGKFDRPICKNLCKRK